MKSLKCDICDNEIRGEMFEDWFKAMHAHWQEAHADLMKEMRDRHTEEEGDDWMTAARVKFDATQESE